MVPSISPFNGNNPSIKIAMIDPTTATLADYRVIAAPDKTGVNPKWTTEYDFEEGQYGIRRGNRRSPRLRWGN